MKTKTHCGKLRGSKPEITKNIIIVNCVSQATAFPDEKEYLFTEEIIWTVTKIEEKTLEYEGKEFKATQIFIELV